MASEKRIRKTKKWKMVLFIILAVWSLVSVPMVYRGTMIVNEFREITEQSVRMTAKVICIAQEWRSLAYELDPEAALATEKRILEREQKQQELYAREKGKKERIDL